MLDFFVPFTPPIEVGAVYESLRQIAGCTAAPTRWDRVYSILFTQDTQVWKAIVGQRLQGRLLSHGVAGSDLGSPEYEAGDAALVIAIFRNTSHFVIVTDNGRTQRALSRWASPFAVHRAVQVVRFGPAAVSPAASRR